MVIEPTPRPEVFDIFWKFAAERQLIFEKRAVGQQGPWTTDRILSEYKFCNVFRAADRVSQYLIRKVAYPTTEVNDADKAFQIVALRTFSNARTWDGLIERLGMSPTIEDLASGAFERALSDIRLEHGGLYTGAFILCATDAYGRGLKHLNHVELFKHMFLRTDFADVLSRAESLEAVYGAIHEYPLMGDFMSYQTAIDLNYSELTEFSENDFTKPGPGALRGISKVFENVGNLTGEGVIHWMVSRQDEEFDRRGLDFKGLWGRPLHAIDVQNLFCETDKYCREALPGLKSARSRIKTRFNPTPMAIDYFFPPKWNVPVPRSVASSPEKDAAA